MYCISECPQVLLVMLELAFREIPVKGLLKKSFNRKCFDEVNL